MILSSKQKQVEIQRPRARANRSPATELGLDILQHSEQFERLQVSLDEGNAIQVLTLARRAADRLGLAQRADLANGDTNESLRARRWPRRCWPSGRPDYCRRR